MMAVGCQEIPKPKVFFKLRHLKVAENLEQHSRWLYAVWNDH